MAKLKLSTIVRDHWPLVLVDLVVVVLGISISFALQNWRVDRAERAEEHRLLAAIESNLTYDLGALSRLLDNQQVAIDHLTFLLDPDAKIEPEPDPDVAMDIAISYIFLSPRDIAWRQVQQSGASRLIRDKSLLDHLVVLYSSGYGSCAEWDRINRDFILQRMIPYLDDHGPFVETSFGGGIAIGLSEVYRQLVSEDRFKNLLRTNRLFREGQRSVYSALKKAIQVQLDRMRA